MSSAVELRVLGVPLMDNRKDHQKDSRLQQLNSGSNSLQTYKFSLLILKLNVYFPFSSYESLLIMAIVSQAQQKIAIKKLNRKKRESCCPKVKA
jgi:hypothetical protein